jgi:hypothetical protein
MMKNSKLTGKQLTKIKLDALTVPLEVQSGELPKPVVGRDYSFSFWIYIENYDQTQNATNKQITPIDKLIFL